MTRDSSILAQVAIKALAGSCTGGPDQLLAILEKTDKAERTCRAIMDLHTLLIQGEPSRVASAEPAPDPAQAGGRLYLIEEIEERSDWLIRVHAKRQGAHGGEAWKGSGWYSALRQHAAAIKEVGVGGQINLIETPDPKYAGTTNLEVAP